VLTAAPLFFIAIAIAVAIPSLSASAQRGVPTTAQARARAAAAAMGANFVATGHDMDFHCSSGEAPECAYLRLVVNLVRNGSHLPILALDQGTELPTALADAGFTGAGEVVTVNPAEASAFNATAFVNGAGAPVYSAIITASDETCGGCDAGELAEQNINARASDFAAFFNAGGGILALAGAGRFATYYNFVPLRVGATVVAPPFTVTPTGEGLGITAEEANCCATHNSFLIPEPPLVVLEDDSEGKAETIAALNATITERGFGRNTPTSPLTSTSPPSVLGSSGAAFAGSVNPEGLVTSAQFEYGLDKQYSEAGGSGPSYEASTPTQAVGSDFSVHAFTASVSGLVPNALYHVRLVATNSAGTTYGSDQTFTTTKDPPPRPPELGHTLNVEPVSGVVFIKPPPGQALASAALSKGVGFVPLTEARQIPVGSQIDALGGSLKLLTASGHIGKLQSGVFSGAVFKATQSRSRLQKGLSTLSLLDGAFPGLPSYSSCHAHPAGKATEARAKSRVLQRLRASAHGNFTTRGRFSAATVRGTEWGTIDRCDGTVTTVERGTVLVRDFLRRKTIAVHAGHSYLASASGRIRKGR
jgi:hypothetical protein